MSDEKPLLIRDIYEWREYCKDLRRKDRQTDQENDPTEYPCLASKVYRDYMEADQFATTGAWVFTFVYPEQAGDLHTLWLTQRLFCPTAQGG